MRVTAPSRAGTGGSTSAGSLRRAGSWPCYLPPATIRLAAWIVGSVAHAGAGSERFWEALVFGLLIFSPRLITFAVALRDLRRWRERRLAARASLTIPSPSTATRRAR